MEFSLLEEDFLLLSSEILSLIAEQIYPGLPTVNIYIQSVSEKSVKK